jgi:toxin-antitoxin system PIN domain toxin
VIVPDVNLLLYAIDSSSPFHAAARAWWEACLSGSEPVGLTHPVALGYVRVGTSARAFRDPLSLAEATAHVQSWLERSVTRVLEPASDHLERVFALLAAAGSSGGNLVTDAEIAAMALAHNGVVHTADRDFCRFPGLRTHFPLAR